MTALAKILLEWSETDPLPADATFFALVHRNHIAGNVSAGPRLYKTEAGARAALRQVGLAANEEDAGRPDYFAIVPVTISNPFPD